MSENLKQAKKDVLKARLAREGIEFEVMVRTCCKTAREELKVTKEEVTSLKEANTRLLEEVQFLQEENRSLQDDLQCKPDDNDSFSSFSMGEYFASSQLAKSIQAFHGPCVL